MGAGAPRPAPPRIFSVSELCAGLRELVEVRVGTVWVAGEISNLRRPGSGHAYFTLKDAGSQLRAVLFRGNARFLRFDPEDGLEVVAQGELSVYEPRGDLQLIVRRLEPRGRGALQLAFEQLRARLLAEGLFDPAAKRALPRFPRAVGVVTSAGGAALRDVLHVSGRLLPSLPLVLARTRVQGEGAEEEIARALSAVQLHPEVDVVLLVRGGGSLEDLLPYNTERLARAIRASRVPVVAGVGHEVDVTIADLAADARAPTPSAAAALAVPDRAAVGQRLARDLRHLTGATRRALERAAARHGRLHAALAAHAPSARVTARRARLEAAASALRRAAVRMLEGRRGSLRAAAAGLDALSPLAVLGRGYAIVQRPGGAVLRSADETRVGEALDVRLGRGGLSVTVRRTLPSIDPDA